MCDGLVVAWHVAPETWDVSSQQQPAFIFVYAAYLNQLVTVIARNERNKERERKCFDSRGLHYPEFQGAAVGIEPQLFTGFKPVIY